MAQSEIEKKIDHAYEVVIIETVCRETVKVISCRTTEEVSDTRATIEPVL